MVDFLNDWRQKEKKTKQKTSLQATASHSNLDNLLRTAVILAHMHNADAQFNNKGGENDG